MHYARVLWVVLVVWVGACTSTPENATVTPRSGQATVTPPAPTYRQPTQPITASNAHLVAFLGRLDAPAATPSTLFSHNFSPDGTRLFAVNQDLLVMWDTITGKVVYNTGRRDASHVYYSDDKNEVYAVDSTGSATVYETERGIVQGGFTSAIDFNGSIDFVARGGLLATGSNNGRVQLWDTFERVSKATISAHIGAIVSLALSQDGQLLATSGLERTVKVWDIATRTVTFTVTLPDNPAVALAFSPDGTHLAAGSPNFLYMYDLSDGTLKYSITLRLDGASDVLKYSPDGQFLVVGGGGTDALLLYAEAGRIVTELNGVSGLRVDAMFSPDSTLLATVALDKGASLWNLAEIKENVVPTAKLNVPTTRLTSLEWSQDGFLLTFFDAAGSVFLWGIP